MTAGPSYNPSDHKPVAVNETDATHIESDILSAWIRVRIKDYHGLPRGSPASSPYFSHPQHTSDRYSIAYSFVPKKDMSGSDLVMGFDYGHSIKHQLPPGFRYAMKIATSLLDPGLYSDPYSDQPYLYGPALSSFFAFRIGEKTSTMSASDQLSQLDQESASVIEEGAYGSGAEVRETLKMPSKWKKRRKFYLDAKALANFTFEKDRMYHVDFFNPHLDFANFALRLPGFSISVARYIDEKTHHLRYVLKNRNTGEVLIVVIFKLLYGKELNEVLEQEKSNESVPSTVAADGSRQDRDHDELTKGHTTEKDGGYARRRASTPTDIPGERGPEAANPYHDNQNDQSYAGQATAAVSSLSSTVFAAYKALGFGNSSPSASDSDASSRNSSPHSSGQSTATKIDNIDNKTVERFLQDQTSNAPSSTKANQEKVV